ncbi:MAG: TetR/AcrR family transcriptional regulator [Deltaproteobacteria bacterium]
MKAAVIKQIQKVISQTKVHKDTFAVPDLIHILKAELKKLPQGRRNREEFALQFVDRASQVLMRSPIYSATLMRDFYRSVLEAAVEAGVSRQELVEDLLFQTLRRSPDAERPRRRSQRDARARILRAALDEFSENGFHQATIDSIAERAGIAKGTVYRYFKTKEELFNALKEDTMSEFVELAKREVTRDADVLQILESVIKIYLGFFEKNSAFFKVIVQEQKDFGREFSEKFINVLILAFPGLKRACWKASRNGHLKQMNYFTVFFGIVGFLNGVIQKWLHDGGEGSLMAEVETVKEVLFYGFAVPPDRAEQTNPLKVIS